MNEKKINKCCFFGCCEKGNLKYCYEWLIIRWKTKNGKTKHKHKKLTKKDFFFVKK